MLRGVHPGVHRPCVIGYSKSTGQSRASSRAPATEDILSERDGYPALIAAGSTVLENDPLVAEFPDSFEPASKR